MESTGKLVIEGIANNDVAHKVIAFLCANTKNMTPEIASTRLKNLPLLLTSRISAVQGTRIANLLCEMGALAVFLPDVSDSIAEGFQQPEVEPVTSQTGQIKPEIPDQPSPDPGPSPPIQRAEPSANSARKIHASGDTYSDRHELTTAQKFLVWGVLAGFLSFLSPGAFLLAVPFQLYIAYRITKALKTGISLRVICLMFVIIPVINIIVLLVLRSRASKRLKQAGIQDFGGNAPKEKWQRSLLAPAYVAVLAFISLVVYSPSWIPILLQNDSPDEKQTVQSSQPAVSKEEHLKNVMETAAQDLNKQLPKEMAIHMRLDKITVEPDNLFTFHITETSQPASAINKDTFRTNMTPRVKKDICGSDEGKPFPYLKEGVSVAYAYSGNDGNDVTTIVITPADCGIRLE